MDKGRFTLRNGDAGGHSPHPYNRNTVRAEAAHGEGFSALVNKQAKQVVIVGAGPGGLAAALLLAKSGVKVKIVEKRAEVGGRTSTIHQDGFKFDTGPTFFLYPRVLREIFAAAGYDLDREVPMTRLDPQYRLVFGGGGELLATPNVEKMDESHCSDLAGRCRCASIIFISA